MNQEAAVQDLLERRSTVDLKIIYRKLGVYGLEDLVARIVSVLKDTNTTIEEICAQALVLVPYKHTFGQAFVALNKTCTSIVDNQDLVSEKKAYINERVLWYGIIIAIKKSTPGEVTESSFDDLVMKEIQNNISVIETNTSERVDMECVRKAYSCMSKVIGDIIDEITAYYLFRDPDYYTDLVVKVLKGEKRFVEERVDFMPTKWHGNGSLRHLEKAFSYEYKECEKNFHAAAMFVHSIFSIIKQKLYPDILLNRRVRSNHRVRQVEAEIDSWLD
jgi:hypothetical protein